MFGDSVPVLNVDVTTVCVGFGCIENDYEIKWNRTLSIQTVDVNTHPLPVTPNRNSRFLLQFCQWCPQREAASNLRLGSPVHLRAHVH